MDIFELAERRTTSSHRRDWTGDFGVGRVLLVRKVRICAKRLVILDEVTQRMATDEAAGSGAVVD